MWGVLTFRPLGRNGMTLALRDGTGTPREISLQRSLALAEYLWGAGRGARSMVLLAIGRITLTQSGSAIGGTFPDESRTAHLLLATKIVLV